MAKKTNKPNVDLKNQQISAFQILSNVSAVYKGDLNEHKTLQIALNIIKEGLHLTNEEINSKIKADSQEVESEEKK